MSLGVCASQHYDILYDTAYMADSPGLSLVPLKFLRGTLRWRATAFGTRSTLFPAVAARRLSLRLSLPILLALVLGIQRLHCCFHLREPDSHACDGDSTMEVPKHDLDKSRSIKA